MTTPGHDPAEARRAELRKLLDEWERLLDADDEAASHGVAPPPPAIPPADAAS